MCRCLHFIFGKQKDIEEICVGYTSGITLDSRRTYSPEQKQDYINQYAVKSADGLKCQCAMCKASFDLGEISEAATFFYADELEMDHKVAWSKGGRTELSNAQLLCKPHNIQKSNKDLNIE